MLELRVGMFDVFLIVFVNFKVVVSIYGFMGGGKIKMGEGMLSWGCEFRL